MVQDLIVAALVLFAVGYLVRRAWLSMLWMRYLSSRENAKASLVIPSSESREINNAAIGALRVDSLSPLVKFGDGHAPSF